MKTKRALWILGGALIMASATVTACDDECDEVGDDECTVVAVDGGTDSPVTPDTSTPTPDTGTTPDTSTVVDAGPDTAEASTKGRVTGSVAYTGTKTGPAVYVALFTAFPPAGPPAADARLGTPTFPATYTLMGVTPGTYTAFAYLSTGTDHNTGPEAGDPTSAPVQVTVTAGNTTTANLTLSDGAPPRDAGDGG